MFVIYLTYCSPKRERENLTENARKVDKKAYEKTNSEQDIKTDREAKVKIRNRIRVHYSAVPFRTLAIPNIPLKILPNTGWSLVTT